MQLNVNAGTLGAVCHVYDDGQGGHSVKIQNFFNSHNTHSGQPQFQFDIGLNGF
jgi:hypothetical protein